MKESDVMRIARREGRICRHCGWVVTKKDWKNGHRLCGDCRSALRGVRVRQGHWPYADEPRDKTGES